MIRLSQLTALEIDSDAIVRDINIKQNNIHLYSETKNGVTESLVLMNDDFEYRQMTKNNAYASFWSNVLLGTMNSYPESALGYDDYDNTSNLKTILGLSSMPQMQFKKVSLYFAQGTLLDSSVLGHSLRMYVKLPNGNTLDLLSAVDFNNDTNVSIKSTRYFDNQIYSEAIEFYILDIDYILNSTDVDVQKIKTHLFGLERPNTYLIEYSSFNIDSIDEFVENNLSFTKYNPNVTNEQSENISIATDDLFVDLKLVEDGYGISSQIRHTSYDVEKWLERIDPSDNYLVNHHIEMNYYSGTSQLIESDDLIIRKTNKFDNVKFRPIAPLSSNYGRIISTIKITNSVTGLSYTKSNSIIITVDQISKFYPKESFVFNVTTEKINNIVEKKVSKIVSNNTVPNVVQVEKKVFSTISHVNDSNKAQINLFNADSYVTIDLNSNGVPKVGEPKLSIKTQNYDNNFNTKSETYYLQIGDEVIKSEPNAVCTFFISKRIYNKNPQYFLLLDKDKILIKDGIVIRK